MLFSKEKSETGDQVVITPDSESETVANPAHYNKGVSPYQVAMTMFGEQGLLTYVLINSIKYIQRYPYKHKGNQQKQLEDLIKARQSLETAIDLHKKVYGDGALRHG
ncbi:MAG: DUF3310 domain-containing protein [bacterium]|jgi:hypothetical protein